MINTYCVHCAHLYFSFLKYELSKLLITFLQRIIKYIKLKKNKPKFKVQNI